MVQTCESAKPKVETRHCFPETAIPKPKIESERTGFNGLKLPIPPTSTFSASSAALKKKAGARKVMCRFKVQGFRAFSFRFQVELGVLGLGPGAKLQTPPLNTAKVWQKNECVRSLVGTCSFGTSTVRALHDASRGETPKPESKILNLNPEPQTLNFPVMTQH